MTAPLSSRSNLPRRGVAPASLGRLRSCLHSGSKKFKRCWLNFLPVVTFFASGGAVGPGALHRSNERPFGADFRVGHAHEIDHRSHLNASPPQPVYLAATGAPRCLGVDVHARAAMVADALTDLLGLRPRSAVPLGVMASLIVMGSGETPVGKTPCDLVELKLASGVIRFPRDPADMSHGTEPSGARHLDTCSHEVVPHSRPPGSHVVPQSRPLGGRPWR